MNQVTGLKKLGSVGLMAVLLGLSGCANVPNATAPVPTIKQSMQGMKGALQPAMDSTTMAEFAKHVAQFKASTADATRVIYSGTAAEQAKYAEGMTKMKMGLAMLDATMSKGDLMASKQVLKSLLAVRDEYHKLLKK